MSTYSNIAKTTGIIGAVKIIMMFFGIIRAKIIAMVLGSAGFGYYGLYNSVTDLVSTVSSLGLNQSGVRQIAKSNVQNDSQQVSKTYTVLHLSILITSFLGALFICIFSRTISFKLFNTTDYYWGVCIVSSVVLFNGVSNGQLAVLNGLKQIRSMAICQIIGAVFGSLSTIILILIWGDAAIPASIALVALTMLLSTGYYLKKLHLKPTRLSFAEARTELKGLLGIGISLSVAAAVANLMTYFSRIYLKDAMGIEVVGLYQSCWTLSNMYVGMILSAMGVDFMPRIMTYIQNNAKVSDCINEQIELGVLIAGIGILASFVFAPVILNLFYSKEFETGTSIIRWQLIGVLFRVFGFSFGYVITAKGKGLLYVIIQSLFFISEYLLLIGCIKWFGLDGLGINYFIAYLLYIFVGGITCAKLVGYRPSAFLLRITGILFIFICIVALLNYLITDPWIFYGISSLVLAIDLYWTHKTLTTRMGINLVQLVRSKLKKNA